LARPVNPQLTPLLSLLYELAFIDGLLCDISDKR
jgi:hypothetical protein